MGAVDAQIIFAQRRQMRTPGNENQLRTSLL